MLIRKSFFAFLYILLAATLSVGSINIPQLDDIGDDYTLVLNADPQIGPPEGIPFEKELYEMLEQFVKDTNKMQPEPAFIVYNGDLVAFAKPRYFEAFKEAAVKHDRPVMLVHGNHDGVYPDDNFTKIQHEISGYKKLMYSWDCGKWHFTTIPSMEQIPNKKHQQKVINWLNADLKANKDKPTMLFVHYHILPVGLSQLEYYTLPIDFKNKLIDTIARYQNVRYVFSGHVHSGVKASVKSSWTYKGTNYVIAPSPVPPRCFGEEFPEFLKPGTKNRGYYLEIKIEDKDATLIAKKIYEPELSYEYPKKFKTYSQSIDPRATKKVWKLPGNEKIINGGFEHGLKGWLHPHRYIADEKPMYVFKATEQKKASGQKSAYLYAREKGTAWAYDEHIDMYQVIDVPENAKPVFKAKYFAADKDKSYFGGSYIRIHCYNDSGLKSLMLFHYGAREHRIRHIPKTWLYCDYGYAKSIPDLPFQAAFKALGQKKMLMTFQMPDHMFMWHDMQVNVQQLYDKVHGDGEFAKLNINKMLVGFGVWAGWEPNSFMGSYFDDFELTFDGKAKSMRDSFPFKITEKTFIPIYGQWGADGYDR